MSTSTSDTEVTEKGNENTVEEIAEDNENTEAIKEENNSDTMELPVMDVPVNPMNPLNILETAAEASHLGSTTDFEKILNFRDLWESDPSGKIKKGHIFRSGLIHLATEKDFKVLQEQHNIKTTIDLRSSDEIRQHPAPLYEKFFPTHKKSQPFLGKQRCRVHVPLWKSTMNFRMLYDSGKYGMLGSIAWSFAKGDLNGGIKTLLSEMNEIKLPGMYKCFVKYVHTGIKEIIEICANQDNYPILIHCSLGKDRTGVMSALISEIVGLEREAIFEAYSKSGPNLFPFREEMITQLKKYYLEEWLADSPKEVIEEWFAWVEESYGSVPSMLDKIGVDKTTIEKVQKVLQEEETSVVS